MRVLLVLTLIFAFCAVPAGAQAEHDGWLVYSTLSMVKGATTDPISLVKADGSGQRSIDAGKNVVDPCFTPDGKSILFSRLDIAGVSSEIATVAVAGGAPHVIRKVEGFVLGPVMSPDQKKIVYAVMQPHQNNPLSCFIMDADGSNAVPIKTQNAVCPRWSKDGRTLAYLTLDDRAQKAQIYLAHADGSAPRILIESDRPMLSLAFSPDGKRIAYLEYVPRDPNLLARICTVDVDGKHRAALTPTASSRMGVEYSADGKQLFCTALDRVARTGTLVRMGAEGGEPTVIVKSAPETFPLLSSGLFFILMMPAHAETTPVVPPPAPVKGGGQ